MSPRRCLVKVAALWLTYAWLCHSQVGDEDAGGNMDDDLEGGLGPGPDAQVGGWYCP